MNLLKFLSTAIIPATLIFMMTACTDEPEPEQELSKLESTLLCEGAKGSVPFTLRCEYFYLDQSNREVVPDGAVSWTLDIALEGIAQRFYSQATGNSFFTEIDRPGLYTLTVSSNGSKTSQEVSVYEPATDEMSASIRLVPVRISSNEPEVHERVIQASPGYEIIDAAVQVHSNSTRVSSRVIVSDDHSSARLIVELQPREGRFNVIRAWFAGNVVLTEQKTSN